MSNGGDIVEECGRLFGWRWRGSEAGAAAAQSDSAACGAFQPLSYYCQIDGAAPGRQKEPENPREIEIGEIAQITRPRERKS